MIETPTSGRSEYKAFESLVDPETNDIYNVCPFTGLIVSKYINPRSYVVGVAKEGGICAENSFCLASECQFNKCSPKQALQNQYRSVCDNDYKFGFNANANQIIRTVEQLNKEKEIV